MVRESQGKIFFQGQDIVRESCYLSRNFQNKHKVREKSGNFEMYAKNMKN